MLQAWLVDAETSEVHPRLSDGQRQLDMEILVENVAAGMLDLAARLDRPPELEDTLIAEAGERAVFETCDTPPSAAAYSRTSTCLGRGQLGDHRVSSSCFREGGRSQSWAVGMTPKQSLRAP